MIQLATPMSHLAKTETFGEHISEVTDCFEVRDHTMGVDLPRQYLYHCDLQPIHPLTDEDFEHLRKVRALKKDLKLVTFHCASCCDKPLLEGKHWVLGGNTYSRQELLDHAKENFKKIREIFGADVKIAIENNNYYKTPAYAIVCDPDFISEVVQQNNLHFLFDVAHAQISAENKDLDFQSYISALPLNKVVQIHLCSPARDENNKIYDAHQPPQEFHLKVVEQVIQNHNPQYLTLEYYKSVPELAGCLKDLKKRFCE